VTEPWLLVAGDLTPLGGMDTANHALARYLGSRGADLHLVTHRAWPDLTALPSITVHAVWRPFNKHLLGSPLLSREAHRVWRRLKACGVHAPRAVMNGGNCRLAGANWVHYLHAAYEAPTAGSAGRRAKTRFAHQRDLAAERAALHHATVVLCNSERTKRDVVERVGVADDRVKVVYYGSDPVRFSLVDDAQRAGAKRALGRSLDRPLVGFVGALGDRRKAFDSIFHAWVALCARRDWDADLVVVGSGAELPAWRDRAEAAGLNDRMTFLGFRSDVPDILAALDALIHPARYEAYGLSVHEAICRGLPALVSASAGVAEQYPAALDDLLIADADDAGELVERLTGWRRGMERFRELVAPVSARLRARTWDAMAGEIVEWVGRAA
jgi:glycosyltransferase involved in cell wall biosynthesis